MRNGKASEGVISMPQDVQGSAYAGVVPEARTRGMAAVTPTTQGCHVPTSAESEGGEHGSVVGCNANNGNASARTANCNNAASNGNDNYAGAFALVKGIGGTSTSCAASTKTTDSPAVTDGQGRCDYGSSLPFWGDNEENNAESNATATDKDAVFQELAQANGKRKLKNLRRFFTDKTIIAYAFDRTMQSSSAKKKDKDLFIANRAAVIDRIAKELGEQTYCPQPAERRVIRKRGKGDKARNADVYTLYDRIVQMLILTVIEGKFRNMMIRNIYSGIKGRSLLSNDRRYCMVNQIRTWVKGHPDSWVGLTDIRHFYESLRVKVVLGEMFAIVVCPFARWLLCTAFSKTEYLPIGGCLSQLMGMFAIVGADRHGMTVHTQRGDKVKFRDLHDDAEVFPIEYTIEKSEAKAKEGKEGYMVRLTYILINGSEKRLCHSTEGSEEVVEFFRLVERGEQELHQLLHVRHDGTRSYFREYHTSKEEACSILCDMFGL